MSLLYPPNGGRGCRQSRHDARGIINGTWRTLAATDHLARSKFSFSGARNRRYLRPETVQLNGRPHFTGRRPAIVAHRTPAPGCEQAARGRIDDAELLQHGDDRGIETALLPVGDLDRDAQSLAADADRLHPLGADLRHPVAAARLHQREIA